MALYPETHLPSGTIHLVRRLPSASVALLGRLERLAYAGLSRVRSDTRLRRGRSFAHFAVATAAIEARHLLRESPANPTHDPTRDLLRERLPQAAHELSRRLGRSPRPSEIATLLAEDVHRVVEVVADDRFACVVRPQNDGGGSHPVEA